MLINVLMKNQKTSISLSTLYADNYTLYEDKF